MDDQNKNPTPPTPPPATPATDLLGLDQPAAAPPPSGPGALESTANGFASILGAVFSWIIFPIAVVLILHNFVFQAYHVLGSSMVPTLHETDYLIISKLGYTQALIERSLFRQNAPYLPSRGQIVVFHYPKDPTKVFVKRVIGTPGDRVVIKNGQVTVFSKDHPEGYNPDTKYEAAGTQTLSDTTSGSLDETVQDGNIFVLGDNRTPNGSFDSRDWGEVPSSYIIGNAVLRLLPLDQVKIL